MGITNSNKQIDLTEIDCNGTLKVTLALSAAPDISENPTDIVLVLDRSGSMAGVPLENMKLGAEKFIDIIDEATDNSQDGNIGGGSHIGIVSFADTATVNAQLITSVQTLKNAVNSITAGGSTNHADAFAKAMGLFNPLSTNAKVIVMFTDGKTTEGPDPSPVAAAARASGIIIYCIGLIGSDGIDVNVLNDWATDPDASHVAVTPDDDELEDLFEDLAQNISKPGATNIVINEVINSDFAIINMPAPTKGTAVIVNDTTIRWTIPELGVSGNEGAALEFFIKHVADSSGEKLINSSIDYSDSEGNAVTFPTPSVLVDCGIVVNPEPCPVPVSIEMSGCSDSIVVDLGETYLESQGRIAQVDVTVKNVCPGKRVALAVILSEVDSTGNEYQRGLKTIVIPAHNYPTCRDVLLKCVKFVLPESLNVSSAGSTSMCMTRNLNVRLIAHNIDTDYRCCESVITVL